MKPVNLQTPKPRLKSSRPSSTPISKVVVRSLDSDFTVEEAKCKKSDSVLNQIKKHDDKVEVRSSDSDFTADSELLLLDLTDPVASSAESVTTQESSVIHQLLESPAESVITREETTAHRQVIESPSSTDLDASSEKSSTKESKYKSEIDLIRKALEETSQSDDISESSKKIIDAMFEAAIDQLKFEAGTKINRSVPTDMVRVGILVLLIILLMWLILVRLIGVWTMNEPDWPNGFPPT